MSECTRECDHPGRQYAPINCPDCGRFSAHSWSWSTYGPDGYYASWGGTCKTHGRWSDST